MFDPDLESQISEVMRIWQDEGNSPHTDPDMRAQNLPLHPEYLYRLSGEWTGWNAFLGVMPDDDSYAENAYLDSIEDLAFARMFH